MSSPNSHPARASRRNPLAFASRKATALLVVALALVVACSAAPAAPKDECQPGDAYYCRCANREEGSRVCNDDGKTYGPCEPCLGGEPLPPEDASIPDPPRDAAGDGARPDAGDGGGDGGATCPNGTVDPGEECDDGNRTASDGCSATCKLEGSSAAADKCPGMAVHVWNAPVVYTGSTTNPFVNDYTTTPSCGGATGSTTPDRVFAVTAHRSGTLRVTSSAASFDHMLYRSETCVPTGNSLVNQTCANAVSGNGGETLELQVTAGSTYHVVIDGAGVAQSGSFTLTWTIQ